MSGTVQTGSEPQTFAATITAEEGSTQILIIDAAFNMVASGTGRLVASLEPGIYKARFKAGNRAQDHLFEIIDRPVRIHGEALEFSSPIPLPGTSNNHEYHYYPSREIVRTVPQVLGSGSELFVFVRDSQHRIGNAWRGSPPWTELFLSDLEGALQFSLEHQGQVDVSAGFASAKLSLSPGIYLLTQRNYSAEGLSLQLPVALCEGWCTHVYVDACDWGEPEAGNRRADLGGASIAMARCGASIDDEAGRLAELARQQFLRGQDAVSAGEIAAMVDGKNEFPMLGLYAAHFMIASASPNWELIGRIASNLDRWLSSGHPDMDVICAAVEAQGIRLNRAHSHSKMWPAMLTASWELAEDDPTSPMHLASNIERFGQYRMSGSMWAYVLRPERVELKADEAAPAAPIVPESTRTRGGLPKRRSLGARPPVSRKSALHMWKSLKSGLARPNPSHSPFQQALRRRLLDALSDDANEGGKLDIMDLARQFRVTPDAARTAYDSLTNEARAAMTRMASPKKHTDI